MFIFRKFSDFYHTSRLSTQNVEICLQNYPPISGNLSITNYLKQHAIDYQSHLTVQNNLKVEISVVISKTSTNFLPEKNTRSTRRGVGRGPFPTTFLAFLVILCFGRRCRKQNTVARLKSKHIPAPNLWAGYA